jgi:uncharacterized membrane protein YecN with MAPEG domain
MELFFILLLLGLLPAFIAMNKGRNFLLWWFYGTVLFVVAIFHAITLKPTPEYLAEIGMRYCPDCDRIVKIDDPDCPHHPTPPPSS